MPKNRLHGELDMVIYRKVARAMRLGGNRSPDRWRGCSDGEDPGVKRFETVLPPERVRRQWGYVISDRLFLEPRGDTSLDLAYLY